MIWVLLIAGMLSALVAAVVAHPLMRRRRDTVHARRAAAVLITGVPLLAFALYLLLGTPEQPMAGVLPDKTVARREAMQLAVKPVERLEQSGGRDFSALAVMAELNLRLGSPARAAMFMEQALAAARAADDPRAEVYAARLNHIRKQQQD